jgi:hypothetical protein
VALNRCEPDRGVSSTSSTRRLSKELIMTPWFRQFAIGAVGSAMLYASPGFGAMAQAQSMNSAAPESQQILIRRATRP